ncbi:hypothetical protein D9V37_07560 [Nocardioides mangrovicus]|uniref:Terpene cyclase/mutase family protein n=1 Tax=Nocardioides mangrovicus TaxID=2478913 RepID=A0A3L8P2W1_9ACTN|nr:hypothetical protein D9V37_07560 [Nocardioides mangrovicus]
MRGVATAAALVLPLAGTALVGAPAQAANDPKPLAGAADWVAGQLSSGGLMVGPYGNDVGLSIDAFDALGVAGGHAPQRTAIANAVASGTNATDYYSYTDSSTNTTTYYANSLAKLLVFAQANGYTNGTYGGQNILTRMNDLTDNTTGVVADSSGDNYASTIGQAYAARGLTNAGSSEASAAVNALLNQECTAGYFSLSLSAAGCTASSTADTDATSIAVIQLSQLAATPAITAKLNTAKTWLASQQKSDGSFGGGTSTAASNANSTGLAGYALGLLGDTAAAQKAAVYVRSLQVHQPAACTDALSNAQGTVGYDAATLSTGRYNGLGNATVLDKFRRATTQGMLVLGNAPTGTGPVSTTDGFARPKAATTISVSGVAPGDSVCVTGPGTAKLGTAGASGTADVSVTAPKSGTASYTIVDSQGRSAAASVQVLQNAKFKTYVSHKRIKRGARQYLAVKGFATGEPVRIKVYGTTINRVANAQGKVSLSFKAGKRVRKVTVKVFGRFGGVRKGAITFKVVR